jgi:hypothetical protein
MRNKSKLTEKELERLTKIIIESEHDKEELDEILTGTKVGDFIQGVKGLYQGEGFYYFKYLSKIKNRSAKVLKELPDIEQFVKELLELRQRIDRIKNIAPEKKWRLLNLINKIEKLWQPFNIPFSEATKEINLLSSEKLSGERLDVIPGFDKNEMGSSLVASKDEAKGKKSSEVKITKDTEKPEEKDNIIPINRQQKKSAVQEEISRFKQLIK